MNELFSPEESFRSSTDRKPAPYARRRAGKGPYGAEPLANAFGLPSGPDYACVHATEWCWPGTCYAHALEMFPGVKNLLLHNWAVFQQHHDSVWGLSTAMNSMLDTFEKDCEKRDVPMVWRWFWDGDIPNEEFARAMRQQAMARPHVQFWVYTRNFEVAPLLLHKDNLTVYLSVDRFNVDAAIPLWERYMFLKYAFCGDSWEETEDLARRFPRERSGPRCPEITGNIPLIVWDEQGTGRGACVECGMCITGTNNVRFSSQKVKSNERLQQPVRLTSGRSLANG